MIRGLFIRIKHLFPEFFHSTEITFFIIQFFSKLKIYFLKIILFKSIFQNIRGFTSFDYGSNKIFLRFQRGVHESETGCFHKAIIVKNNVEGILLTTNSIFLAAVTINFNLNKFTHLLIKSQPLNFSCTTCF